MNPPHQSSQRHRPRDVFSEFTGFVLRILAAPSEDRPTVRCISRAHALKLAGTARAALDDPELHRASAEQLLDLLEKSGVLERLTSKEHAAGTIIYGVGPGTKRTVEPMELLMAAVPDGVICYFTALAYYGFTTQLPTHHHIAKLSKVVTTTSARAPSPISGKSGNKQKRNQLGTRMFEFDGLTFYRTARGKHTLAGVQERQFNDRSIIRITTREQTLLDTLHRPLNCGGPTVVWEAWSRPLEDLNLDNLTQHLIDLGDRKLARRVGYMLAQRQQTNHANLMKFLRDSLHSSVPMEPIPLLPGLTGGQIDPVWHVQVASS